MGEAETFLNAATMKAISNNVLQEDYDYQVLDDDYVLETIREHAGKKHHWVTVLGLISEDLLNMLSSRGYDVELKTAYDRDEREAVATTVRW